MLSGNSARRYHRFNDSFSGSLDYLGLAYLCLVHDISQHGLRLWSAAPVEVGDRMSVDLRISQDVRFSCVIEIRQVASDGLRAEIVEITDADAGVLGGRIEEHYSAVRLAKARAASAITDTPSREQAARRREKIAARAYYHAERRGFDPGGQVDDWLRAEREIDGADGAGLIVAPGRVEQ